MNKNQKAVDYQAIFELFDDIFLHDDKVQTYKIIKEFHSGKDFAGDYFLYLVYEPMANSAPRFYNIGGPFDLISKKAPETAQVFENGQLIFDIDYAPYVKMRTGAMDSYILRLLKTNTSGKKILYIGAGKVAQCSVKTLKHSEPHLSHVDYSAHASKAEFEEFTNSIGVEAVYKQKPNLSEYDFIFMHTNTSQSILKKEDIAKIKPGAIITTFITSTEHGEVADEFYQPQANVIIDLEENFQHLPDIKRAVDNHKFSALTIKKLLQGKQIDKNKKYTIFRSGGTALQDYTMVKLLMSAN